MKHRPSGLMWDRSPLGPNTSAKLSGRARFHRSRFNIPPGIDSAKDGDGGVSPLIRAAPPPTFSLKGRRMRTADNPPIASISHAANYLNPLTFQKIQRHQPAIAGPRPRLSPSRRREARSAGEPKRRRERRERAATERSGRGGPRAATPAGQGTGNNPRPVQERSSPSLPAARGPGHLPTTGDGPGASKTSRAERLSFAETVFKLSHPGEGPDAPPSLSFPPWKQRGAEGCAAPPATPLFLAIPP